jgi:MFS-type transporter involved in bile tolerance (Atg22 family)
MFLLILVNHGIVYCKLVQHQKTMKTSLFDRKIFSWCLFDFANSSYSAVIAAVIFPVYYTTVIVGNDANLGDLWWEGPYR